MRGDSHIYKENAFLRIIFLRGLGGVSYIVQRAKRHEGDFRRFVRITCMEKGHNVTVLFCIYF